MAKPHAGQLVSQEAPMSAQCLRSLLDFCCFCGKTNPKGVVSDTDTNDHWICCFCTQKLSPKPLNCKLHHRLPNFHKSEETIEKVVEKWQDCVLAKGESSVENILEGAIFDLPTMVFQKVKDHMFRVVWDPTVGHKFLHAMENKGFTQLSSVFGHFTQWCNVWPSGAKLHC